MTSLKTIYVLLSVISTALIYTINHILTTPRHMSVCDVNISNVVVKGSFCWSCSSVALHLFAVYKTLQNVDWSKRLLRDGCSYHDRSTSRFNTWQKKPTSPNRNQIENKDNDLFYLLAHILCFQTHLLARLTQKHEGICIEDFVVTICPQTIQKATGAQWKVMYSDKT